MTRCGRNPQAAEAIWLDGEGPGFTLWEILVTLSLISVLFAIMALHSAVTLQATKARIEEANIRKIEGAVQLYRVDMGFFPRSLDELVASPDASKGWQGPYLKDWPLNPWDPETAYRLGSYGQVLTSP